MKWSARSCDGLYFVVQFGLLTLLVTSPVVGQENPDAFGGLFSEPPPAFTQEQADAWMKEVIPHVERIANRQFRSPPVMKVVTRGAIGEALVSDVQFVADPELFKTEADIERAGEIAFACMEYTPALFGKYSLTAKAILLPAGNITVLETVATLQSDHPALARRRVAVA